jgi:hypothetical protein
MRHFAALAFMAIPLVAAAKEDIEFVAEHLPEVAMDNRFATLPMWGGAGETGSARYELQGAFSSSSSADLEIEGPLLGLSWQRSLSPTSRLGLMAFYDSLRLKASNDSRQLQTLFAPQTPIERPVDAHFTNLDGTATDLGGGVFWSHFSEEGFLGAHTWIAGLMWQRVELRDYRLDYELTAGPQNGMRGQIDFDTHYDHFSPLVGLQLQRLHGEWSFSPHALLAYPLPRRGFQGHITGPGFDISGNTEQAGAGKHFGDPSVTLGLTLTYLPAHLSFDVGTFVSQALLESTVHRGIERNLLLSFSWTH